MKAWDVVSKNRLLLIGVFLSNDVWQATIALGMMRLCIVLRSQDRDATNVTSRTNRSGIATAEISAQAHPRRAPLAGYLHSDCARTIVGEHDHLMVRCPWLFCLWKALSN